MINAVCFLKLMQWFAISVTYSFTIMAYCWASMPAERPSFSQLQICLSEFHTQITRYV